MAEKKEMKQTNKGGLNLHKSPCSLPPSEISLEATRTAFAFAPKSCDFLATLRLESLRLS